MRQRIQRIHHKCNHNKGHCNLQIHNTSKTYIYLKIAAKTVSTVSLSIALRAPLVIKALIASNLRLMGRGTLAIITLLPYLSGGRLTLVDLRGGGTGLMSTLSAGTSAGTSASVC